MVMKNIYRHSEHPFAQYVRIVGKGKSGSRSAGTELAAPLDDSTGERLPAEPRRISRTRTRWMEDSRPIRVAGSDLMF